MCVLCGGWGAAGGFRGYWDKSECPAEGHTHVCDRLMNELGMNLATVWAALPSAARRSDLMLHVCPVFHFTGALPISVVPKRGHQPQAVMIVTLASTKPGCVTHGSKPSMHVNSTGGHAHTTATAYARRHTSGAPRTCHIIQCLGTHRCTRATPGISVGRKHLVLKSCERLLQWRRAPPKQNMGEVMYTGHVVEHMLHDHGVRHLVHGHQVTKQNCWLTISNPNQTDQNQHTIKGMRVTDASFRRPHTIPCATPATHVACQSCTTPHGVM